MKYIKYILENVNRAMKKDLTKSTKCKKLL